MFMFFKNCYLRLTEFTQMHFQLRAYVEIVKKSLLQRDWSTDAKPVLCNSEANVTAVFICEYVYSYL